jgi:hypothetical protein
MNEDRCAIHSYDSVRRFVERSAGPDYQRKMWSRIGLVVTNGYGPCPLRRRCFDRGCRRRSSIRAVSPHLP